MPCSKLSAKWFINVYGFRCMWVCECECVLVSALAITDNDSSTPSNARTRTHTYIQSMRMFRQISSSHTAVSLVNLYQRYTHRSSPYNCNATKNNEIKMYQLPLKIHVKSTLSLFLSLYVSVKASQTERTWIDLGLFSSSLVRDYIKSKRKSR